MDEIKEWAAAAGIRAVKTAAQTAIATIGATAMFTEVDWAMVGSAVLLSAVLSLLTSLAGIPEAADGASPLKKAE